MAGFKRYSIIDKNSEAKYPNWLDASPNLQTFLTAINLSSPISQCQYEMIWSRWPRTIFFAKNISIPGIETNTVTINHAGFTIPIPTHVKYDTNEITFQILADKEGYHYYDIRNMVMQSGHPLIAGDTKSTISSPDSPFPDEDAIEVRLRNKPDDDTHHHWIIHNFRPTKLGNLDLQQSGAEFVEFELTGTFTHINYDCGMVVMSEDEQPPPPEEETPEEVDYEEPPEEDEEDEPEEQEEDEEYPDDDEYQDPEDEPEDEEVDDRIPETEETTWEDEEDEPEPYEGDIEDFMGECPEEEYPNDEWEDWNDDDWGGDDEEVTLAGDTSEIDTDGLHVEGESDTMVKSTQDDSAAKTAANEQASGLSALTDGIASAAQSAIGGAGQLADSVLGAGANLAGSTLGAASGVASQALGAATDIAGSALGAASDIAGVGANSLGSLAGAAIGGASSLAGSALGAATNVAGSAVGAVGNVASGLLGGIGNLFGGGNSRSASESKGGTTIELSGMTQQQALSATKTKLNVLKNTLVNANVGPMIKTHLQKQIDLQRLEVQRIDLSTPAPKDMKARESEMKTSPLSSSQSRQLSSLIKAVKFNHNIGKGRYVIRVKPSEEIKNYKERITKLSLPNRFGMYRPLSKENIPFKTKVDIEEPTEQQLDSTYVPDPNHKRRGIFD